MIEITRVALDNEMDLILAHKQSMRLAELAGLSLSAQTTFATAVSEVSRNATGAGTNACLKLYVSEKMENPKFVTAVLEDSRTKFSTQKDEGYIYAKKLVSNINARTTDEGTRIELNYRLQSSMRIDDAIIEKWRINLNTDPSVSPYEEIKRKNRQLVEMADKLRESEQQYKTLTDSLPIMIYSMTNDGLITYANQWLHDYTGQTTDELNTNKWKDVIHPEDFTNIWENWLESAADAEPIVTSERRLKDAITGEYKWHTGVSTAITEPDGSVKYRNTFMVDIHAQKMIEQALKDNKVLKEIQEELEEKVGLLNLSNQQLERFAYVASHDLQEPLRKISFYSDFLKNKYGNGFPEEATMFFDKLIQATARMKILVQDVLSYSTIQKAAFTEVDLNIIAKETLDDLEISIREKNAKINIGPLPVITGNSAQLKQLFENLVSNSLKFSTPDVRPEVSISAAVNGNTVHLSFSDNGIGFEDKYMSKMFDIFQRLHTRDKYSGTGIGLAICKKIIDIHNGAITANGTPGKGAIFLVTLPLSQNA